MILKHHVTYLLQGEEIPGILFLTSECLGLVLPGSHKTKFIHLCLLKEVTRIHRVFFGGYFTGLSVIIKSGESILVKFESEDFQNEVSTKIVRMRKFSSFFFQKSA